MSAWLEPRFDSLQSTYLIWYVLKRVVQRNDVELAIYILNLCLMYLYTMYINVLCDMRINAD